MKLFFAGAFLFLFSSVVFAQGTGGATLGVEPIAPAPVATPPPPVAISPVLKPYDVSKFQVLGDVGFVTLWDFRFLLGASFGYRITPRLTLLGELGFTLPESSDDTYYSATDRQNSQHLNFASRFYLGKSFYFKGGLGYRHTNSDYYSYGGTHDKSEFNDVGLMFGLGNQWTIKRFLIGWEASDFQVLKRFQKNQTNGYYHDVPWAMIDVRANFGFLF